MIVLAHKAKTVTYTRRGGEYTPLFMWMIEKECKEGDIIPIKMCRPPLYATVQISTKRALYPGDRIIIYRGLHDRKIWARLMEEFNDGRFRIID